jgi:hypothetical protein
MKAGDWVIVNRAYHSHRKGDVVQIVSIKDNQIRTRATLLHNPKGWICVGHVELYTLHYEIY